MDKKLFVERVEEALREPAGSLAETSRLRDMAGWDSIGFLAVIAVIDEHYGVTLDPAGIISSETVGDLMRLVQDEVPA